MEYEGHPPCRTTFQGPILNSPSASAAPTPVAPREEGLVVVSVLQYWPVVRLFRMRSEVGNGAVECGLCQQYCAG